MDREPYITLGDAGRLKWLPLRRKGSQLSARTLLRWHLNGQRVNGRVIRLRVVKVGATHCTTESWLHEHFVAVAVAEAEIAAPATVPSPGDKRRRDIEDAAILDAAGLL